MGFTAIINDMDWSAASFLNEITGALQEREQADGGGAATSNVTILQDVQDHALFAAWQAGCEGLAATGKWCEDKNYDGEATIPILAFADVLTLAGIPSGFRRATEKPTDWTDYSDAAYVDAGYGQCQEGDIIGPWLFADLQAVLKKLVATKRTAFSNGGGADKWGAHNTGTSTCAAIKAVCEAFWKDHGAAASAYIWAYIFGVAANSWEGEIRKGRYRWTWSSDLWDDISRSVDWYAYCQMRGSETWDEWDANGETVIKDAYSLWNGAGAPEATTRPVSAYLPATTADTPLPVWPACPTPVAQVRRGWMVGGVTYPVTAVVRWNVAGGFTYV